MIPEFNRCLLVVAAPIEAKAVAAAFGVEDSSKLWARHALSDRFDMVRTGIGKANAAAATALAIDPGRQDLVASVGIAGALPGGGLELGALVVSSGSVFADEGIETPTGFQDCATMGFPLGEFDGSCVPTVSHLKAFDSVPHRVGRIATVSTCSGTDALARRVVERTGAIAECMEGAAVGLVAHRRGVLFSELRVISNTTGDRERQVWDIRGSLSRLTLVIGSWAKS